MIYTFSTNKVQHHFLDIKFETQTEGKEKIYIELAVWRPGRYELGNFAKNICKWEVTNENGTLLPCRKISKSHWEIESQGSTTVIIDYSYYAAELNAGSTYLDQNQLYVNPVNCCVYCPDTINEPCEIVLNIPNSFKVAIGLETSGRNKYYAKNFHDLADSPFIASESLKKQSITIEKSNFHLWFQGICEPKWDQIIPDFSKFIQEYYKMMTSFPFQDYHFLFQILPTRFYHGVEHLTSTVIALGPGYDMNKDSLYNALLGVSSHELFHAWNIKSIRPIEMFPYDYSKENYSKLGYVAEGVTTYYGDLMLFRSGVFNERSFFKTFNDQLQKHFDNFGRFNMSVADSSFDTWLDGYEKGIPNRKVSIYTEGCLIAFICDIRIREKTANAKSLDDVMRMLYTDFAQKGRGYSEMDYKSVLEFISGVSFDVVFKNLVWGTNSYEPFIESALHYLGLEISSSPSEKITESKFGFKFNESDGIVTAVFPNSPAEKTGLWYDDRVVSVNGIDVSKNSLEIGNFFNTHTTRNELIIERKRAIYTLVIEQADSVFYRKYFLKKMENATSAQEKNFTRWSKQMF